jgi:uncharacterized Tic20 family protein
LSQLKRPSFALRYYLLTFLVVLAVAISVVRRIWPVDEFLDAVGILAIAALLILTLFEIYCAWRAKNGR